MQSITEQCVRDEAYAVQRPVYRTVQKDVPLHRSASGQPDDLEGLHLHGFAGRCARPVWRIRFTGEPPDAGDHPENLHLQRHHAGPRSPPTRNALHGLPSGAGDVQRRP